MSSLTVGSNKGAGLALGVVLLLAAGTACADRRPYTIDDHLALEALGAGVVAADRLIWEQAPPYDRIGYYGNSHIGAWRSSGFTLRTLELTAARPTPQPLFEPEPGTSYWIDSISADGRYLAFYSDHRGRFSMGAYDLRERRLHVFKPAPVLPWLQGRESVWISAEEFVYNAYAGDTQPPAAARPYTGKRLQEEWAKAWAGGVSVSIEDSNPGERREVWQSGGLYKANARTGELTLLAEGRYESPQVSASGRFLSALRQADLPPPDPSKPNEDWVNTRSELVVFDLLRPGAIRVVAPEKNFYPQTQAWAPDADLLAYFAWDVDAGLRTGLYHAFDARTGAITPYPHHGLDLASERERGYAQKPERVMWIDGRIALFARRYSGSPPRFTYRDIQRPAEDVHPLQKADWFLLDKQGRSENLTARFTTVSPIPMHADARSLTVLADGQVWRVGPHRAPKHLTAGMSGQLTYPSSVQHSTLHRVFQSQAILENRNPRAPGFVLLDLHTGTARFVPSPASGAEYLAGAARAGAILFSHIDDDGLELSLTRTHGGRITIDRLNRHLGAVIATRWKKMTHTVDSPAGTRRVQSCVLLPANYLAGRRYPVVVEVYPSRGANCIGPTGEQTSGFARRPSAYSEHLLAAQGYVVLRPNTSRDLIRTAEGPLGAMTSAVLQALDALVQEGIADPTRAGIMGFSQGGFSSLWVAAQTDRFQTVVSLNSWADMYSHYFDASYLENFYTDRRSFAGAAVRYESKAGTDFSIGKTPYEAADSYVRNSPLFRTPHISAAVLLVHSDMDTFPVGQYERMYTALRLQGKRARLLRYWGEGHSPSSPGNIRHLWAEIINWFAKQPPE